MRFANGARGKAALLGMAVVAAAGGAVLPAGTASAAPAAVTAVTAEACWDAGWTWSGKVGGTVDGSWRVHTCRNVPNTVIRQQPSRAYPVAGTMTSGTSWFVCKTDEGGDNGEGNPHPFRWLWTQSDTGGWGWMADTAIYSDTNTVPDCLTG